MRFTTLLLSLVLCAAAKAQSLTGKVTDETNQPIPHCKVNLYELGILAETDSSGVFSLNSTLPATFLLYIEKQGYETYFGTGNFPQSQLMNIVLKESHIELEEVVIIDSRSSFQKESVVHVDSKKISDLNAVKATNLGEALNKIPGVYTASTGNGISKPVVRGLSGTRVLTLLNGIRIENQQWGSDHGMGIASLGIGNVEIIKGPSSLYYGSDALGGIVYSSDENYAANGKIEERIGSSFEFNGLNSQSVVGVKLAQNHFRLNAFAGYNTSADFRLPNKNYLVNSRYNDQLAKLALGYNRGRWVTNLRYTYLQSHVGIPGESEDSVVTPLSYQSDKTSRVTMTPFQGITNHVVSWENKFFMKSGGELAFNVGNTNNSLSEFEESMDTAALEMLLNTTVYTARFKNRIGRNFTYNVGYQGMLQYNRNGETAEERLIPDANTMDNGAFLVADLRLWGFNFQAGVRGDLRSIQVVDDSIQFFKNYNSINYAIGAMRRVDKSTFRLSASTGFRAPHTSELLANGAHEGALRYEIGSTELKTENATQVDFSYEYNYNHLTFIVNPFYSQINNYIYLNPLDSVIEERPVYQYTQAESASLYGVDAGVHLHPHSLHGLHLEMNYSYIRGERRSGTSLPFIPQSRINALVQLPLGINSEYRADAGYLTIQYAYYFKQDRITEFETATGAYSLLDIGMNLRVSKSTAQHKVVFTAGVKNILNATYNNHLSSLKNIGIPQQGRNFYVGLTVDLQQKL